VIKASDDGAVKIAAAMSTRLAMNSSSSSTPSVEASSMSRARSATSRATNDMLATARSRTRRSGRAGNMRRTSSVSA
jgi:hypothetical protein